MLKILYSLSNTCNPENLRMAEMPLCVCPAGEAQVQVIREGKCLPLIPSCSKPVGSTNRQENNSASTPEREFLGSEAPALAAQ